jgi:hypothetical protein
MIMFFNATHEEITASVETLKPYVLPHRESLTADTLVTASKRVVTIFHPLIPLLMLVSSSGVFPASWRAGFTLLTQALDALATVVSATPASPVIASLASSDGTTTDPTSTDPSFKAGKDL